MALVPTSAGAPARILRIPGEIVVKILSELLVFDDDKIHLCYTGNFYLGAAVNVDENALAILRTCRILHSIGSAVFFQKNVFNLGEPSWELMTSTPQHDFPPQFCSSPVNVKSLRSIRHILLLRMPHPYDFHMPSYPERYPGHYVSSFVVDALAVLGVSLDSLTIASAHNVFLSWPPVPPLNLWTAGFDSCLYSFASDVIPCLRRLLLLGRIKTLRFVSFEADKGQFDGYQLVATWTARVLSSFRRAHWGQKDLGPLGPPQPGTSYKKTHLIAITSDKSGFTLTRSRWELHWILYGSPQDPSHEWLAAGIDAYEQVPRVSARRKLGGDAEQISRARLGSALRALLDRGGENYWLDDAYDMDRIDHGKVCRLLVDWESNPQKLLDLPPPTAEVLEAVGDGPEAWQAALLAGLDDRRRFNPFARSLCLAVSNHHLSEVRPQDLDWMVEAQKGRALFKEGRQEGEYRKWIPDHFPPVRPENAAGLPAEKRRLDGGLLGTVPSRAQTKISGYFEPVPAEGPGRRTGAGREEGGVLGAGPSKAQMKITGYFMPLPVDGPWTPDEEDRL